MRGKKSVTIQHPHCSEHFVFFAVVLNNYKRVSISRDLLQTLPEHCKVESGVEKRPELPAITGQTLCMQPGSDSGRQSIKR